MILIPFWGVTRRLIHSDRHVWEEQKGEAKAGFVMIRP